MDHQLILGEDDEGKRSLRLRPKWGGREAEEVHDGGRGGEESERLAVSDCEGLGARGTLLGVAPTADVPGLTGGGRERE